MTFADVIANAGISVLDLAQRYSDLSETLRRAVVERIDDEYGLEIPQLYIVNVSVPAEVERALDARASMTAIGDLSAFQAYQLGHAMPEAAANPAGGLAGAGVGLGMGMAMTNAMGGVVGPTPPPSTATPPPLPAAEWHIAEDGRPMGPLSTAQLAQRVAQGSVTRQTLVWSAGMEDWRMASQVEALAPLFGSQPPPLPRSQPS
jgi:hypothetical protein